LVQDSLIIVFLVLSVLSTFFIFIHASIICLLILIDATGSSDAPIGIKVSISLFIFNLIILLVFMILHFIVIYFILKIRLLIIRLIVWLCSTATYRINLVWCLSLLDSRTSLNSYLVVTSTLMVLVTLVIIETIVVV
jgi:hypothetical protein